MYLFLIGFVILAFIFYHYYKLKNFWKSRGIPGPPTTYILGNLHEHLNTKRVNVLQLQDWTKEYGKLYGMLEGERKMLITTDLDFLYEVFVKQSDIFHGRRLTPLLGNVDDHSNFLVNVFNARGNRWKRLRTLANPIFNVVTLKTILPTVQDSVNETLKYIEEKEGHPINAYPFFQEFTIDVISRIALGQTSSAFFNNEYLDIVRDVFEKRRETFGELLGFIFPFFVPILKSVAFYFQLSTAKYFTKAYGKLNQAVRERKKLRESNAKDSEYSDDSKKRIDFIDLFLDAETANIQEENSGHFDKTKIKVEKKLSTYEVVAMCFVFLLAGYDTTATSIGYFVYLLAKNPEAQKKIQEEIDSICPNHEPTYEDLQKFKYLEAAIKESLRLYPLAARAASRQCMETTTVNGLKIEKGIYVTADVFTIHYSKEIWGEDSEEFKPERFLSADEKQRHPMSWLPFGAGPRICLGMRLAYMEEKAFIIGLLKKFNIQKTANTPEKLPLYGALVVAPESVDVKFVHRF